MKIPNATVIEGIVTLSLARIVSEDSQLIFSRLVVVFKSSKDS